MPVYTDWTVGRLVTADGLNANHVEEREEASAITSDSSTWDDTPEVSAMTVTSDLVSGDLYKIWFMGRVSTDVAGDYTGLRIREDSISGTQLQFSGNIYLPTTTGNGFPQYLYAQYTAVATAAKTFVLTGARQAGTGTAHRIRAASSSPAYFVCERVMD